MKTSYLLPLALQGVAAFPAAVMEEAANIVAAKRALSPVAVSQAEENCGPMPCLVFDAEEQLVSVSGLNKFIPPGKGDLRGPCPGLNAAANHGYLSRTGVTTIAETIAGLGAAYGMSPDLAGFLAAYGIALDGDIVDLTWSIGGPQPGSTLGGLLGAPKGISYSHNNYEGDTSMTRADYYVNHGDAYTLQIPRFVQVYETGLSDDRYTLDRFRKDFRRNVQNSIMTNPHYFAAPVSTTLVAPAAYNFVINFMSNHTESEPNGYLNGAIFKSFFAITGDYPNFKYHQGHERIPENWYRRTSTNQYNIPNVFEDLAIGFAAYPSTFRLGGNTNGVNTYKGIDISLLTGGTYKDIASVLKSGNLACLLLQVGQVFGADLVQGKYEESILKFITPYFTKALSGFSCPTLGNYTATPFSQYPGFYDTQKSS